MDVTRMLVLFDVDGVLVEQGGSSRLPGTAEAMAQLRHGGHVLSLLTGEDEDSARRRTTKVGVDRYLDYTVAACGGAPLAGAVQRAEAAYGGEFTVVVVAAETSQTEGADHVVTNLVDLVPLAHNAEES
jgi:phosphoglycolate phosphatase-like HAD superfamily hydrolase